MTEIVFMVFLSVVGGAPNGSPLLAYEVAPTRVTLEECIETAHTVNESPDTTQIVMCYTIPPSAGA